MSTNDEKNMNVRFPISVGKSFLFTVFFFSYYSGGYMAEDNNGTGCTYKKMVITEKLYVAGNAFIYQFGREKISQKAVSYNCCPELSEPEKNIALIAVSNIKIRNGQIYPVIL